MKQITFTSDTFKTKTDCVIALQETECDLDSASILECSDGWIYVIWDSKLVEFKESSNTSTSEFIKANKSPKGACKLVWKIADECKAQGSSDRKTVMQKCKEAGITYSTSSIQYKLWSKAQ